MNISFLKVVKMTLAVKYAAVDLKIVVCAFRSSGFIRRAIEHSDQSRGVRIFQHKPEMGEKELSFL